MGRGEGEVFIFCDDLVRAKPPIFWDPRDAPAGEYKYPDNQIEKQFCVTSASHSASRSCWGGYLL